MNLPKHLAIAEKLSSTNLYLIGFAGTGKTTIGRLVAERLGFNFLDSDQEIILQQGKTIATIFAEDGESAFRVMEREFIEHGHPVSNTVVSCGGGLMRQPGMIDLLKQKGVVIYLHASIETILKRILNQTDRPLFNVENSEIQLRELYTTQCKNYPSLSITPVFTDDKLPQYITNIVIYSYQFEISFNITLTTAVFDLIESGCNKTSSEIKEIITKCIAEAGPKQSIELARLKYYLAGTSAAQLEGIFLLIDELDKGTSSKPACEILRDELAARDKRIAELEDKLSKYTKQ